ncbi:MAG: hypothetical protein VB051_02415 [Candidatus Pelethousia sp.]|nr:hypothetical protein [Candidatus Pelethousia sp.]
MEEHAGNGQRLLLQQNHNSRHDGGHDGGVILCIYLVDNNGGWVYNPYNKIFVL